MRSGGGGVLGSSVGKTLGNLSKAYCFMALDSGDEDGSLMG